MSKASTCPECMVPSSFSAGQSWLDNGDIVQKTSESARMMFMECQNLDPLFANIGIIIGFPVEELIQNISARGAAIYMERLIPQEMKELIRERTGAGGDGYGQYFKLNPRVSDLPEKFSVLRQGVRLMVLGGITKGGGGCACPENALLKALLGHLIILRDDTVIVDMEAGIEHLGMAKAKAVDKLIVVVEPWRRAVETAYRVSQLAQDLDLHNVIIVGNKIRNQSEKEFIISNLSDFEFLGFIPYDQTLVDADLANRPLLNASQQIAREVENIYRTLVSSG